MGRREDGGASVGVSLDSLIFCFQSKENVMKKYGFWYGYGYVRNTKKIVRVRERVRVPFFWGYGNVDGVRVDLCSRGHVKCTERKWATFLVRVRGRVRVTFRFGSTGTDSVPVPALRGMLVPQISKSQW